MKISIIGTAWPYRGGLAAFIERLATQLQNEGHEVKIETFTMQYPGFLFPGKSQFADWPAPPNLNIERTINSINPLNWFKAGRRIRKEMPDMVIFKYWLPLMAPCFGTIARIIRKNRHSKIVTILDNIIPHEKRVGDRMLTSYFVKPNHGFIAMSESVLIDLGKFDRSKPGIYSPHPVFDNFGDAVPKKNAAEVLNLDPSAKYILFFGLVRDYKGLDLLIKAFADKRFRSMGIKVLVAGEFYTDSKPYIDMIREYGLTDEIILHPEFIPDMDVASWFCVADLIVQPYKSATQSGVTQIGYHFEKPMLVTNVGGLPEIIPHMKGGYVVSPEPGEIADAIYDFFDSGREEEFTAGIRKEKVRFSWETMAKNISLLLDQINEG
jgi:glycosyltransferase involved in cell wall biosynthesis